VAAAERGPTERRVLDFVLVMVFILSVLGRGSFDRAIGTIAPTGRTMRRLSVQEFLTPAHRREAMGFLPATVGWPLPGWRRFSLGAGPIS
jgi:hypothetical protein